MPLKKTRKILIIISCIGLVVLLVYLFILWNIKSNSDQFSSKAMILKSELDTQNAFLSMKKDWEENDVEAGDLNNYIIPVDGVADFMKSLDKITSANNLKSEVNSISFVPVSGGNYQDIELLDVKIDTIGEWKNVRYFLDILENYPLAIDIRNFNISRFSTYQVKGVTTNQWLGSFEFTILKLKDNK
jgi:hypothetical protein